MEISELEAALIGAICADQSLVRMAARYLTAEDFSASACGAVFEAALDADGRGKLFDGYIAADVLTGKIDKPRDFIAQCLDLAVNKGNAEEYAKIIKRDADERVLRERVSDALATEHGETLTEAIAGICAEQIQRRTNGRMKKLSSVMDKTYDGLFEEPTDRIDTGYGKLDYLLKGLWGGELIIVAARPSVGKSAFALSIAESAARHGKTVQFYSLEMEDTEIGERLLARWTQNVTMNDIIDRDFREDEGKAEDAAKAMTYCAGLPIFIDDSANVKPSRVRSQALTQKDLGLIIVDYGGLMASDRRYDKRHLELGAISRDLKNIAKELKVPVVMLAQLNRGVGDDEKPSLRELRDSGELEQNANKCVFLWNTDKELGEIGVFVAKNRKGRTGELLMRFDGDHMRFTELEKRYEPPKRKKRSESVFGEEE